MPFLEDEIHGSWASGTAFKLWVVRIGNTLLCRHALSSIKMKRHCPLWSVARLALTLSPYLQNLLMTELYGWASSKAFGKGLGSKQAIPTFILCQPTRSRWQWLEQMGEWALGLTLSWDRYCLQTNSSPFVSMQVRLLRQRSVLNSNTITRTKWF